MRNQLTNIFQHCDTICVFGGNEDTALLNKYRIKTPPVIDIQIELSPPHKGRVSLDKLCSLLKIDLAIENNGTTSCGKHCMLPKKSGAFKYKSENINPHNAIGDSIRLFLVCQKLFIHRKNNPFKIRHFSKIR